jgi:hypothetical protein
MKLSPNEKQGINTIEIAYAVAQGLITWQEMSFYIIIRDHAFPDKKGRRGTSFIQVHQIAERLGDTYTKKRIKEILSRLIRAGFIRPHYFVRTKNGDESFNSIEDFDGPNGLGRKRIAYTKYEVLLAPTEKKARKEALKRKNNT